MTPLSADRPAESAREAFDLSGRVAVITGAGSGIGKASAVVLAECGADVVCADLDLDRAEATAKDASAHGVRARAHQVDVTRREEVDALVAAAVRDCGRIDIMGNIAGVNHASTPVLEIEEHELDRVFAVNYKGVLFGCQAAGAVMAEQGSGSIINMASAAVDSGAIGRSMYAVSKVSVVSMTRTLALELAPRRVRVNAIAPGAVVTGMTRRHFSTPDGDIDSDAKQQWLDAVSEAAPLGIVGDPLDIAYAVLYLASDAARFVTGQIIRPNGGITMPW